MGPNNLPWVKYNVGIIEQYKYAFKTKINDVTRKIRKYGINFFINRKFHFFKFLIDFWKTEIGKTQKWK